MKKYLDKKVKTLMNGLSVALYDSLPIEVNVENWSGKEIAIVNLIEPLSQNKNEFNELYEFAKQNNCDSILIISNLWNFIFI